MSNLIGISGKIGSGKDTVGAIIQYLICLNKDALAARQKNFEHFRNSPISNEVQSGFAIKKFADKLKDCVCLIIGCTREQLEDQEFKNAPLGPEWDRWLITSSYGDVIEIRAESQGWTHEHKQQMTPRLMLQLLGTDAGRNIIHPNIWVNASFAEYKLDDRPGYEPYEYPNWIFTDMRFPNELDAIKSRGGITIRVNRPLIKQFSSPLPDNYETKHFRVLKHVSGHKYQIEMKAEHESETALDNSNFDYVVDNSGSIQDLIDKVRTILQTEKII